jgi:hypothetical protein
MDARGVINASECFPRRAFCGLCGLAVLLLSGCGDAEVPRGRVFGTVTVEGSPLKEGKIRFFPLGEGIGGDADIVGGSYEIAADRGLSAGKYRVEVSLLKATGKQVPNYDGEPGAMMDEIVEAISPMYNRSSQLVVDYDPSGDGKFDFSVEFSAGL